jgi:hypothetical protein
MVFRIDYAMWGTGWANLTVTNDEVSRQMEISYIGPDITDLAWQTATIVGGADVATIEFQTEPGEHVWTLHRRGDMLDLRIESDVSTLLDIDADEWRDDVWTFEATLPLRDFALAVLTAFDHVLMTVGPEGYRTKWLREISGLESANELRAALRE